MVLTIAPARAGPKFELGAIGVSIEADELATRDLSATHPSLVVLMRLLGPAVLRLGGDSVDYSWWTSDNEAPPAWAASVIEPADLVGLKNLLVATGWRVILGVDLGHFDPTRAANEAQSATRILGSRLLGFEIGNEPNDYGIERIALRPKFYSPSEYLHELAEYDDAMRAVVPTIRLYGPDLSSEAWLPAIASERDLPFAAITQHYYPTTYNVASSVCKGTPTPTALELLSPQVREREDLELQVLIHAGHVARRETRISETNTTASCDTSGGPDTSPVFASALWSLDWALRTVSAGVAGINFHGYLGRCKPGAFSPICAPGYAAEGDGQVVARPEYYGLLAARQLEGGSFIKTDIQGQAAPNAVSAYATRHPDGAVTVAIDNFATQSATVLLKLSGYGTATSEALTAPSISATSDVRFGHATFSASPGYQFLPRATPVPKVRGAFRLRLAPTSAIVITLHK
jgi:hypothetical protein